MEIYLMQHGLALSEEEDPERPLSSTGKTQIQASAKAIRKMGLRFDVIIASTKRRSRQTAEIIAETTGYQVESIVETESVKPSAPPEAAIECFAQFEEKNSLFIAGHLPSLAKIASLLLTKDSRVSIQFENGGLCCIEVKRTPRQTAGHPPGRMAKPSVALACVPPKMREVSGGHSPPWQATGHSGEGAVETFAAGSGELRCYITPEQLRLIAE